MTPCRVLVVLALLVPAPTLAQMATVERIQGPGWWPTKPEGPRQDYAGPAECAKCHPAHAATQQKTSMARTGDRAAESEILRARRLLNFTTGRHTYTIERSGDRSMYSVSDGNRSISTPLAWAFGAGKVGQSFLFERDGRLHESRVSYYDAIRALDFTPNRQLVDPAGLEEAAARPIGDAEARRCFACHTTAWAATPPGVNFGGLISGVTCEACHGPGRRHVTAMRERPVKARGNGMMRLRSLSAADSVDFCGACHSTFWDVKLADERGIAALRSQPYRLQSSRCWQEGDAQLTCVACHDPHVPLVRDAASYDARCTACHSGAPPQHPERPARTCRIATTGCVKCHMPKYEVPGMHFRFTDHLIRIARSGGNTP